MPEVGDFLGVSHWRGVVVLEYRGISYFIEQCGGDVDEVDARIASGGTYELLGIGSFDEVDVGR